MKCLAMYNIKGGVGKTAAAVNLAYLAASGGARTLIWDMDPQGASSFYLRVKPGIKGGGSKLVRGKSDIDHLIRGTDYEFLDLLPADFPTVTSILFSMARRNQRGGCAGSSSLWPIPMIISFSIVHPTFHWCPRQYLKRRTP